MRRTAKALAGITLPLGAPPVKLGGILAHACPPSVSLLCSPKNDAAKAQGHAA
jgi:hypothetical protein